MDVLAVVLSDGLVLPDGVTSRWPRCVNDSGVGVVCGKRIALRGG